MLNSVSTSQRALFITMQHSWDGNDTRSRCLESFISFPCETSVLCLEPGSFPQKPSVFRWDTNNRYLSLSLSLCLSAIQYTIGMKHHLHTHSFIMQWNGCTLMTTHIHTHTSTLAHTPSPGLYALEPVGLWQLFVHIPLDVKNIINMTLDMLLRCVCSHVAVLHTLCSWRCAFSWL